MMAKKDREKTDPGYPMRGAAWQSSRRPVNWEKAALLALPGTEQQHRGRLQHSGRLARCSAAANQEASRTTGDSRSKINNDWGNRRCSACPPPR